MPSKKPAPSTSSASVSERAKARGATGCLRVFFLIFLAVGSLVVWSLTVKPLMRIRDARNWRTVPCTITSSNVASHSGSDSTTYSVDIHYRYEVGGREFQSGRYRFESGSDSSRKEKDAIVRSHPVGMQTLCFVNPRDPGDAVIDRGPHRGLWMGALGLVFVVVGGGGFLFAPAMAGKGRARAVPVVEGAGSGPVELKPKYTPLVKFLGMLAFCVVWNGFIGIFFHLVFLADDARKVPFFAKAIVGLFSLIGVLILFGAFRSFLAIFNPRLRLTAGSAGIPLGGVLQLEWEIDGRAERFTKLRIVLEGSEEATYRRGTDTSTDTDVFLEIPVLDSTDRADFRSGSARITVPAGAMHTFIAPNNKVLWRLRVEGTIARFPDVKDEYPVTILPAS